MLNPDGVINGNYRCSLAGCDLNRRWKSLAKFYIQQYLQLNSCVPNLLKKEIYKYSVISMGTVEEKIFLCMVATFLISQKRQDFFLS